MWLSRLCLQASAGPCVAQSALPESRHTKSIVMMPCSPASSLCSRPVNFCAGATCIHATQMLAPQPALLAGVPLGSLSWQTLQPESLSSAAPALTGQQQQRCRAAAAAARRTARHTQHLCLLPVQHPVLRRHRHLAQHTVMPGQAQLRSRPAGMPMTLRTRPTGRPVQPTCRRRPPPRPQPSCTTRPSAPAVRRRCSHHRR